MQPFFPPRLTQFWVRLEGSDVRLFCNPMEHLSTRRWHEVGSVGRWDVPGILRDYESTLIHSVTADAEDPPKAFKPVISTLFFNPTEDVFIIVKRIYQETEHVTVWAADAQQARSTYESLRTNYMKRRRRKRGAPVFQVLSFTSHGPTSEAVELLRSRRMSDEDLELHYGQAFPEWTAEFLQAVRASPTGVTILRGAPGTGKTSLIRHLMHVLKRSHRFYYLPVSEYRALSNPSMAEFWINETREHRKLKKVVILEDAEAILLERGADNREHLSNLLNISDGLLGEFLQVQLICTINCEVSQLDRAVVRSGRLIAFRNFRRLSREEASRLASHKGLELPPQEDYSLAEIYNGPGSSRNVVSGKAVGFGKDASSCAA